MSKRNEVLYLVWSVSGRASISLMSKFIEFVDEIGYHDHAPVKFKRWNEITDEDFEKEFMNDNK